MVSINHTEIIGDNLFSRKTCLTIRKVLKLATSTSLLLSLNGLMVAVFCFFLFGYGVVNDLLLGAFLVTFAVYGLNRVTDKVEDSINRPETAAKSVYWFLVPSIASMFTGLVIGLLRGVAAFIVLLTPLAIGLIYSVKPLKSIPRLKDIVGVKSIVVAASWALTGCLLPVTIGSADLEKIFLVFAYVFIRILVGTILCDVLDVKGDSISGVKTIPLRLGTNKTKKLLVLLNSVEVLWFIYCLTRGVFIQLMPALIFGCLYGYLSIWYFFREKRRRLTAELMLDGEWFPIVALATVLVR
jgi:4-hydroxybenzoate polyprenyltransferase